MVSTKRMASGKKYLTCFPYYLNQTLKKNLQSGLILISGEHCFLCCQVERKDLTDLKVYAIDVDEADEVHLVDLNGIFVHDS